MADKILVIDDEPDICQTVKRWLEGDGYEVSYRNVPQEGLELAQSGEFPVVLMDIRMPGEDGITLLKKIKKSSPTTLVILMTGFPSDDTVTQALTLGAYDYLVKPFDLDKLLFLMKRAISFQKFIAAMKDKNGPKK